MSGFQRLVAIPQEEYAQMTTVQNVRQPLTQQLYQIQNDYKQNDTLPDPYRRVMLQSENLEDMKELKDKMRNYLTISTPKPYRTRAQSLFESIEKFVKFNERGEIRDPADNVIENSRLEDLIQHAVKDRRRNITPIGWTSFVDILKENNVPRSILNRETLIELGKTEMTSKIPRLVSKSPKKEVRESRPRKRVTITNPSELKGKRRIIKSRRYPSVDFLKDF